MIAFAIALLAATVDTAVTITTTAAIVYCIDRNRRDTQTINRHGPRAKTHTGQ